MSPVVCIAGKNQIAVNAIDYVIQSHPQLSVLALPNKGDDGVNGWQPSYRRHAAKRGVRIAELGELQDIPNLLFISLEFAEIIRPSHFKSGELFNVHFSLLPKYKGMYTSAWPLLMGERSTGVTLHRIDRGIDTGDIVAQSSFAIQPSDTAADLYARYLEAGFELFKASFGLLVKGGAKAVQQPYEGASYFSKRSIDYSKLCIDFSKTAFEVVNQFRAYTFREFQLPTFAGWDICAARPLSSKSSLKPGTTVYESDRTFAVSTIDFDVELQKDFYRPFWAAAVGNDAPELERLAKFIPDLGLRSAKGWSAAILAAYHGNAEALQTLLRLGVNPNSTNYKGTTLLMYAFSHFEKTGRSDCFDCLLAWGADAASVDDDGRSIADYMVMRGNTELLHLVEKRGG